MKLKDLLNESYRIETFSLKKNKWVPLYENADKLTSEYVWKRMCETQSPRFARLVQNIKVLREWDEFYGEILREEALNTNQFLLKEAEVAEPEQQEVPPQNQKSEKGMGQKVAAQVNAVQPRLSFSKPNAKIDFYSFSLPAGWTCPGAQDCLTKANKETGKIQQGPETTFRCFAASSEAIFPAVRKQRHSNFDILKALKSSQEMAQELILSFEEQVPSKKRSVFRLHVSGDFFSDTYFQAWMLVAKHFSGTIFYAYTKSVNLVAKHKADLPRNLRITASMGGKFDDLIDKENLKYAVVVFSPEQAENFPLSQYWQQKTGREKGLPIDHDDSHAWGDDEPFALLLHGIQAAGSPAAKALKAMGGKSGISSYNKDKKKLSNADYDKAYHKAQADSIV